MPLLSRYIVAGAPLLHLQRRIEINDIHILPEVNFSEEWAAIIQLLLACILPRNSAVHCVQVGAECMGIDFDRHAAGVVAAQEKDRSRSKACLNEY
jgi:hypothetical protein